VIGFTNGIAVLIGLSQLRDLMGLAIDKMPADFFTQIAVLARHLQLQRVRSGGIGVACVATWCCGRKLLHRAR
jgi:SulP family sulfate permease